MDSFLSFGRSRSHAVACEPYMVQSMPTTRSSAQVKTSTAPSTTKAVLVNRGVVAFEKGTDSEFIFLSGIDRAKEDFRRSNTRLSCV